jgi:dinuclear metal center YbgI/SA1388 family protein
MALLGELISVMETIVPPAYAEAWDNVGLLVGDPTQSCKRVLLTIDYTEAVALEARKNRCDAVIAYHPPIFDGLKRVTAERTSLVFEAIRHGVAIYSPHTALDVAEGGTNDVLADAIGLWQREPLRVMETKSSRYKLVVFVPEKDVGKVSDALFAAGAGEIGKYSSCSFRSPGTGTFFGEAGSHPRAGKSGRLETVAEVRLETVVPISKLSDVLAALRASHPYEEPAFDLNQLAALPEGLGQGRIGTFASAASMTELLARIKRKLGLEFLLVNGSGGKRIRKVAICAGSGGDLLDDAISQSAQVFLTGELRHHDALKAERAGMNVICTLHSNSERGVLKSLKIRLEEKLPGVRFMLSRKDRDPFTFRR